MPVVWDEGHQTLQASNPGSTPDAVVKLQTHIFCYIEKNHFEDKYILSGRAKYIQLKG